MPQLLPFILAAVKILLQPTGEMLSPLKAKGGPKSVKLYWRVIREVRLSLAALGFLAVMKTFRGSLGIIPSGESLAKVAGCTRKTAFKYIRELKAARLIRIVKRYVDGKQTSNCYLVEDEQMAKLLSQNAQARGVKKGTRPLCGKKGDTSTSESSTVNEPAVNIIPLSRSA